MQRESSGGPSRVGGVALLAIQWHIEFFMVGVGCLLVVGYMACRAGIRGIGIVTLVASVTVLLYGCVRTVQFIEIIVYREAGWSPARLGAMTGGTIGGNT